ncbi:MAG: DUF11 domain-containing protein, partial [Desulfuromonadales bacterium]|nr:DUF11 domain-containing protein [Desulfuromonadales bacterium]
SCGVGSLEHESGRERPPNFSFKAANVNTASASYVGSAASVIDAADGSPAPGSWQATDTWPQVVGASLTSPYFQFSVDTSKYGGASLSFRYLLSATGDWTGSSNYVYAYSSADGGAFSTIYNSGSTIKAGTGSWLGPISANAAATGNTTTFRINAAARHQNKASSTMGLDEVQIFGCPAVAPPTIGKAFSSNVVAAGGRSILTFTITNPNASTDSIYNYSGLSFTDAFPEEISYVSTTANSCGGILQDAGGGTLQANDTGIRLVNGTLNANTSCSIAVQVAVAASSVGPKTNTSGYVAATQSGPNTSPTGVATATLTALAPPVIEKRFAPNPVLTGEASILRFTLTNPNPNHPLSGVAFTDTFPANLRVATPVEASHSGCGTPAYTPVAGGGSLSFSEGTIAPGASCTVQVKVAASAAGEYLNISSAVSHLLNGTWSGNPASDTLWVEAPSPAISLLKQIAPSSSGPWQSFLAVTTGDPVYYRLMVENLGDVPLSPVTVTDPLVSTAGCSWPATLPVAVAENDNHLATCVIGPVTTAAGERVNTATATGRYAEVGYADQSSARYATTGLTLGKNAARDYYFPPTGEPPDQVADVITYTFEVTNSGHAPLRGPVVIDDPKVAVACAPFSTVGDGDDYLDPAETIRCTAGYTVSAADLAAKVITNTATAIADGVTSPAASKTVRLAPDLVAVKSNDVDGLATEGGFRWTLSVTNATAAGHASFPAGATVLVDDLPAGATYGELEIDLGEITGISCAIDPETTTLACTTDGEATIPAGAAFAITVPVTVTTARTLVNPRINDGTVGLCRVNPDALFPESNDENNRCADAVTVAWPEITLVKMVQAGAGYATPGAEMLYTIVATNSGRRGTDADTVVITDLIPPKTALVVSSTLIAFLDGTSPKESGLSFNPGTDLTFLDAEGAVIDPQDDGNGVDARVSKILIHPKGSFEASDGTNHPTFTLYFKVRIK